jgi:pyruvate dehydrogenase E2 component (dihydrolipoamide acetyltransferase)
MIDFCMPSLGADMESAVLVEWMVKPGDTVASGDVVAVVETQKGAIEIEIFEDGIIDQILVDAGFDEVPVGTPLARVRGVDEKVSEAVTAQPAPVPVPVQVPSKEEPHPMDQRRVAIAESESHNGKRVRISPLARKIAADLHIDLTHVHGTGPRGTISRKDIEAAAKVEQVKEEKPVEPPSPVSPQQKPKKTDATFQEGMRQAIAAAMARSNRDIPHYYLETQIDMTCALAWLEAENNKRSIQDRLLPAVVLLKAVARSLEKVPELNGYWLNDRLEPQESIHIGFAIALRQGGLVTPAIHNVDLKSLDELMVALRDLITRTRSGRLRSSEMTDPTITVTNLGDLGVKTVYGVIYPPQVALIGLGKVIQMPWAENNMLGIRPIMTATVAGDHRATDGRIGSQFLEILTQQLQEVEKL